MQFFLSDDNDSIQRKVMKIYTDPNRLKPTDKGTTENNPLWIFHDVFNTDSQWVEEAKALYRAGEIGDVACKKRLVDILVALISPMRERREYYANDIGGILRLLQEGNAKANAQAEITLGMAKEALKQTF